MTGSAPTAPQLADPGRDAAWDLVRERLRERGLRWTPQRRTLVEVLSRTAGHVSGSELVERCRAIDRGTVPSTVYRTLDVLEELGFVSHHHGIDGHEEFHVLPNQEHGHLHCSACFGSWEMTTDEADAIALLFETKRGFAVARSHISVVGRCAACRSKDPLEATLPAGDA